jgi:adenosylcobinamide-GDP ribazoletransferase
VPDLAGLRLSLTTFTVLPIRAGRIDRRVAGAAMAWSPLVGAGLGGIAAAVDVAATRLYPGPKILGQTHQAFETLLLAAALAILTLGVLTRGLHLDGLADTIDGLSSRKPAAQALDIMREGPVGALGVAALIGVLGIDVAALSSCALVHRGTQALLVGVVTGRVAMVWGCTTGVPAARTDGMGALVAGSVSRFVATAWTVVICAGGVAYGRFGPGSESIGAAVRGFAAVVVPLAIASVVLRHAMRRLGGVTGDVMGAIGELAAMTSFLVTAIGH